MVPASGSEPLYALYAANTAPMVPAPMAAITAITRITTRSTRLLTGPRGRRCALARRRRTRVRATALAAALLASLALVLSPARRRRCTGVGGLLMPEPVRLGAREACGTLSGERWPPL